jgi:hypothetical protein
MSPPTAGRRCVRKLQKPVSLTFQLRILLGKLYGVGGLRSAAEVCQAKIRSQHAIWMQSAEVDALFGVRELLSQERALLNQIAAELLHLEVMEAERFYEIIEKSDLSETPWKELSGKPA